MNLQQLQYIVALADQGQFVKAAEKCFVSQPTLSVMIRKLEEELDVVLFDRQSNPVKVTPIGQQIVQQAKVILSEANRLQELVQSSRNEVSGLLRMGVIPTVAPFLLPLFLKQFLEAYPKLDLELHEMTTRQMLQRLEEDRLDVGILAIPVRRSDIREVLLYEEPFFLYDADPDHAVDRGQLITPEEIDRDKLWLLEEGHCLRSQILHLCDPKSDNCQFHNLKYAAGSIDSLKRIVDVHRGLTIMPGLAALQFDAADQQKIRNFQAPVPVRQIGLAVHRLFVKETLLDAIKSSITSVVAPYLARLKGGSRILEPKID